jgi:RNA polymerase sigma-70 factor (ECF subfamily)
MNEIRQPESGTCTAHRALESNPGHDQPNWSARQTVDRQLVQAALQMLSIENRQALFECYFRGASIAEAANTLGVPPGTVKSRTHYALRTLRQAIDGMGGVA